MIIFDKWCFSSLFGSSNTCMELVIFSYIKMFIPLLMLQLFCISRMLDQPANCLSAPLRYLVPLRRG